MQLPIGAISVSAFALLWTAAGASKMGSRWLVVLVASALTISVATVFAAANIRPVHPVHFNLQAYNISIAFETILVAIAVVVLTRAGRKFLLLPAISIVVGLHFYGMVWALGSSEYLVDRQRDVCIEHCYDFVSSARCLDAARRFRMCDHLVGFRDLVTVLLTNQLLAAFPRDFSSTSGADPGFLSTMEHGGSNTGDLGATSNPLVLVPDGSYHVTDITLALAAIAPRELIRCARLF